MKYITFNRQVYRRYYIPVTKQGWLTIIILEEKDKSWHYSADNFPALFSACAH